MIPSTASLLRTAASTAGLADSPGFTFFVSGIFCHPPFATLELSAEAGVVRVRRAHGRERLVQRLEAQIPHEGAVDIFLFGIHVPALRHRARIDLAGE